MYTAAYILLIIGAILTVGGFLIAIAGPWETEGFGFGMGIFGVIVLVAGFCTGGIIQDMYYSRYETACLYNHGVVVKEGTLCMSSETGQFIDIQID